MQMCFRSFFSLENNILCPANCSSRIKAALEKLPFVAVVWGWRGSRRGTVYGHVVKEVIGITNKSSDAAVWCFQFSASDSRKLLFDVIFLRVFKCIKRSMFGYNNPFPKTRYPK